jgi:multiple sugar transport system ATP-binding protein
MSKILKEKGYIGKEIILGIRPENISDTEESINKFKNSTIKLNVDLIELMGAETYIYLSKNGIKITARVNGTSNVKIGESINVALDPTKIYAFDKDTKLAIS